jgi:hypothetical protein
MRARAVPLDEAREAALEVLRHNAIGPCRRLPRAAGWGYPEPYTRDLMIASLGILASGDHGLVDALRRTLVALAEHQSPLGHIPSLAHDPGNRGASDTTPLFLLALGLYRRVMGQPEFLEEAAHKALTWMRYQSPDDQVMVAQLPTSDWRDEQFVVGYALFVNTIVYSYLRLFGREAEAEQVRGFMSRLRVRAEIRSSHVHDGLVVPHKPYFALYSYKVYHSERFDLLGNSLAILTGIASPSRARRMISWIEAEVQNLRETGQLALDLPPCLFPYIRPDDPDWRPRYERFNRPGDYHNGGVWPFICGFYVAACVAAGRLRLARAKLAALTEAVRPWRERELRWGFNEWLNAQTGSPAGRDWQTWSASMYLYAAACVERRTTPFFEWIRAEGRGRSAPVSSSG